MEAPRRTSKKRQAIYDFFRGSTVHPSAEQVYAALKPQYPDLSLGTVYRNIGVLLDDGLIFSVGNVGGEERYDARLSPHSHFVCTRCGAVCDVFSSVLDEALLIQYADIESELGVKINAHSLSFKGLCADCKVRNG